jgi:ferritin-like metal-binding protein YciE
MKVKTTHDLFVATLKDIFYAEKRISKALPKMIRASEDDRVTKALEGHLAETLKQIERLEGVFKAVKEEPAGKKCEAIDGILKEGEGALEDAEGQMINAAIIASGQAVEHYEIVRYRGLISYAGALGLGQGVVSALQRNLDEEMKADEKLTSLGPSFLASDARRSAAA